eukprot:scaffold40428_cov54-Phaeocystis_antarctica.AAC.3
MTSREQQARGWTEQRAAAATRTWASALPDGWGHLGGGCISASRPGSTLKSELEAPFCVPMMNNLGQQPCSSHCCSSLGQPFHCVRFGGCGFGIIANAGCSEPV